MSTYTISQSSLLSLKAEILKKREELSKAKIVNEVKLNNIHRNSALRKNKQDEEEQISSELPQEDENVHHKSRVQLEAKSKLYDKLLQDATHSDNVSEENRIYLVRFDKKAREATLDTDNITRNIPVPSVEYEGVNEDQDMPNHSDEEWVEYEDCLGRTRTCMKKDLQYLKEDDERLKRDVNSRYAPNITEPIIENTSKPSEADPTETSEQPTDNAELQSADMRRELLRQEWEKQEEILKAKKSLHYQDVLFGEARVHGVAYYGFSNSEEERSKQQDALRKLRKETKEQQQKTQELKMLRDKQMAARLKAARNRKRARMGLPPEEDEPEADSHVEQPSVEPQPEKDEQELAREEARKNHVRPWDIGKEGVKEFYQYTQEEWVDKKRAERPEEFAPPTTYRTEFHAVKPDVSESYETQDKSLRFSTKQNMHKKSTKRNINPYKMSYEEVQQPIQTESTPIVDECVKNESEPHMLRRNYTISCGYNDDDPNENPVRGQGVEIAPPSTFEYYGPNDLKRRKIDSDKISLEESIDAGLQFLRREFEKKEKSTKHPDEMFLM